MKAHHSTIWIVLICAMLIIPSLSYALSESMLLDPFYAQSVNKDNSPIGTISEHVDPFSGNLSVVQTDIHLPGTGGLDLNITRAYNSAIWGRRDLVSPGFIQMYENSPLGIGWSIHMGILRNPRGNGSSNAWMANNPVFELPDGTLQVFFKDKNNTSQYISKDFWKMSVSYPGANQDVYTITAPDGTVYTAEFGTAKAGYSLYDGRIIGQVTSIKNAAGTATISITYHRQSVDNMYYINTITDSVGRQLNFSYNASKLLQSIAVDSRTFKYAYTTMTYSAITYSYLSAVTPHVGNPWSYTYDSAVNTYQMNKIGFPTGGAVSYAYADTFFSTGKTSVKFRVIKTRTTSGRGITAGTWTYGYNSGGTSGDITTITAPGVTETHKFFGWGNTGANNVWKVGLPMSKAYSGNLVMSETYAWSQGSLVSNDVLSNANWAAAGYVSDSAIYVPFLSSKSVTRDAKTYTTNYSSFNIYGDPQTVAETGDISRTKSLTYWTNATKNIVKGKPASESVSGGFSGTGTTAWTYDANSGNPTQITTNGVVTKLAYGSGGNLSSVIDANSKTTSYAWTNGRISKETNPIYSVSRAINTNGTIASETNGRGYTTNYSYDGNLRLTNISPPVGNATSFTYPADSSYRKETRGGYWIQHNYDGYARPTGSSDSKGVTMTVAYNAYGVKDYTDSNVGDKTSLDYFGRAKQVVHKDTKALSYAYSGSNVTVTDENSATQTLTYSAFGNPNEKYLIAVKDRALNTTTYTRNIFGSVTGITQGSVTRSFTFNTKNFLTAESTPEGGSVSYGRDNIGTRTSKTDSTGTKNYAYDNLYRPTGITSGTGTISYGYDNAGNRTAMTSPSATFGYTYDAANRMTKKTETIAGKAYSTSYGYDANDNITSQTYPSARAISYGYNNQNQATSISGFGGSITSVNYNIAGLPTSFITSNGITNSFTYNTRNFTTAITAGSALKLSYGYDTRGNTTSISNLLDSTKNQTLGYDALSRLTGFNGAWGSGSFGYDSLGNRTSKVVSGSSTSYAYSSNRLNSASGGEAATYSYNGNGALSGGSWQGGSYSLGYDPFSNLQTFSSGTTTLASFGYDGDGMRATKSAGGNTTVYHYDQAGHVISENGSTGALIADYVYLNGMLVAKIIPTAPLLAVAQTTAPTSKAITVTKESVTTTALNTAPPLVEAPLVSPTLTISTLANNATTTNTILNVSGTVSGINDIVKSVTVNGQAVTITGGTFTTAITLVSGANTITTIATDNSDATATDTRTITLDNTAPDLNVSQPADNGITGKTFVSILGDVTDQTTTVTTKVNDGSATSASINGTSFSSTLNLAPGLNTVNIIATDQAGKSSSVKRTITSSGTSPTLAITDPAQDSGTTQASITISGTVMDYASSATVDITVDDQVYTQLVGTDGNFSQVINLPTDKTYTVVVECHYIVDAFLCQDIVDTQLA